MSQAQAIPRSDLKSLMERRNAPGLLHFGLQSALLVGSAIVTVQLAASGDPLWLASVTLCSLALLAFFPSLHEAGHQTAFSSPWLNEVTVWISAVLMLQVPSFFRAFHWEHHRNTQDILRDPEIASAPELLDGWPKHLAIYAANVSGQPLLLGKAAFTIGCALLPAALWGRFFPFLANADRRVVRRIAWESRVALVAVGVAVSFAIQVIPGFAALLLAWPISHLWLGFYLMPEHTGLGHEGTQLERTRTVTSNACVRWWMWNMPYHAEHHAHPGVPFHAVPSLHDHYAEELPNVSRGYLAFHALALRRTGGRSGSSP